jgi:hypothetical protein
VGEDDGSGRRALVIATARHEAGRLDDLTGPLFDATAMANALRKLGRFSVDVVVDRSHRDLRSKIEAFLFSFAEHETALIYFSGHGFKTGGDLWLAATDTDPRDPAETALDAAQIRALLEASKARARIWILDCCNAAAAGADRPGKGYEGFFDGVTAGTRPRPSRTKGVAATANPPHQGRGLYYLFAVGDGQPAADGDNGSPYTSILIEGMTSLEADRDSGGWVSAWELARYVDGRHRALLPEHHFAGLIPSSDVRGAADGEVWMFQAPRSVPRRPAGADSGAGEATMITTVDPFRAAVRAALRDRFGPASGAGAGLALGTVTLLAGHSTAVAAVTGAAIGLGGYLSYLAGGIIWALRAGRGTERPQPPSLAR